MSLVKVPSVLLLFGLAGCGKTHVGRLAAQLAGRFFYDADVDVTPAMAAALAAQQPFTDAMRDEFFGLMADRVVALQQTHGELVVTQAVYRQKHRDYLLSRLPGLELVLVEANEELISQRIQARSAGISLASATALRADFEVPGPEIRRIRNDGDDTHLLDQLNRLFG
ncbi:MAG: AAA family ATPase [Gammaproteobacteria bacterium]|nr:AAA family ATPase [Gammaproteobacteria bacterium]